jgi:hypothetical protein
VYLEKWSKRFDFSEVEKYYAPELATLIENQDLMNQITDQEIDLQLVFDTYSQFVGRHLVSVQAMTGPSDLARQKKIKYDGTEICKTEFGEEYECPVATMYVEEHAVAAATHYFKELYYPEYPGMFLSYSEELTREIVKDLRAGASTRLTAKVKSGNDLWGWITHARSLIFRKTLLGCANWVFTSPEIISYLKGHMPHMKWRTNGTGIHEVGDYQSFGMRFFVDPLFPRNQVLVGRRARSGVVAWQYDAGYQFCPYIPFTKSLDLYANPCRRVFSRFARHMPDRGGNYYALLMVEGI